MSRLLWAVAALGTLSACATPQTASMAEMAAIDRQADRSAVVDQVRAYIDSINSGDIALAKTVWSPDSANISFISAAGISVGWPQVERNVHVFFRDAFSARNMTLASEPVVQFHGDTAVVLFIWNFDGTFRDGRELHTRGGRESQVFEKIPGLGWRLIHAHYSVPPQAGD